jgi:putative membrane protein
LRKLIRSSAVIVLLSAASAALAQTPSVTDDEFVTKAAVGNTFEIEESKLALEKASDEKVKQFAQHMIDDHQDALRKLQEAAGDNRAKAEAKLDEPHQAKVDNLKAFSGRDFDKIYIADQIASHDETVNLLSDYRQNGQNEALSDWADDALPSVKQHKMTIDAM